MTNEELGKLIAEFLVDNVNDLQIQSPFVNHSKAFKDHPVCAALREYALAYPIQLSVYLNDSLRNGPKESYPNQQIAPIMQQLNYFVAERINRRTYPADKDAEMVYCVARAATLGAIFQGAGATVVFTGYRGDPGNPDDPGHVWVRVEYDGWISGSLELDPFRPDGLPTIQEMQRRDAQEGFNPPNRTAARDFLGKAVAATLFVGGILAAIAIVREASKSDWEQ